MSADAQPASPNTVARHRLCADAKSRHSHTAFAPRVQRVGSTVCPWHVCAAFGQHSPSFSGWSRTDVSLSTPTNPQLEYFGCDNAYLVLAGHQWYRLLTAIFVHIGIIHIATNMWCLWNLGLLGEPLVGPWGLVAVYVLTGVCGNLLSITLSVAEAHLPQPSAGLRRSRWRGSLRRRLRHRRNSHRPAFESSPAHPLAGAEAAAQIRGAVRRHQPGHRPWHGAPHPGHRLSRSTTPPTSAAFLPASRSARASSPP